MTAEVLNTLETEYDEILAGLKKSLSKIRTGRANTDMLDDIRVEYYGEYVPLNQVATLRIADARLIEVQPWEKDLIPEIEKAIRSSDLGLNPMSDSELVRVPIPALSGERREELSDLASQEGEEHKIALRKKRRAARDEIEEMEGDSEISQDVMHRALEEIDDLTQKYQSEIDEIVEAKIDKIQDV